MTAELVLGTAQFGLDYGIVNSSGKVSAAEIRTMLDLARASGVVGIDTAAAYGDAEQVLGRCGVAGFRVVTKVPHLDRAENAGGAILSCARRSLEALGCSRLDGLLLHAASDLAGRHGAAIYAGLCAARDAGLTERVGVSVYDAEEIELLLDRYPVDLVQMPLSIVDQQLLGMLPRLVDAGIAVHARSVFLQGVMLRAPDELPVALSRLSASIAAIRRRASTFGVSVIEAALAFVRDLPGVEGVVVGATSSEEFRSILRAFATRASFDAGGLAVAEAELIDPRRWSKT
jgi:aryl-alcohol dehydrogenase-like predicted oxidoreductase